MSKWSRVVRVVAGMIVCVVVVAGLLLWLAGTFTPRVEPGDTVDQRIAVGIAATITCQAITVPTTQVAVGTVQALREAEISAKILARIKAMRVRAGQTVKRGDVLVELDATDLQSRLEQAGASRDAEHAALDQAKADFDRIKRLLDSNAATKREYSTAENAMRGAQARLEGATQAVTEAKTLLDYAVLRSPMDGMVIDKLADVGDMAKPGQPLVRIFDQLQLVATVPESLAAGLIPGEPMTVTLDAIGKTCQATVSEIVPEADPISRSFQVKVIGPCAPGIIPGMFGRLAIPTGQRRELRIPAPAVLQVGQLDMVLIVEDGFVRRQFVRTGKRIPDPSGGPEQVEILSGLSADHAWTLVADAAAFWAGAHQ